MRTTTKNVNITTVYSALDPNSLNLTDLKTLVIENLDTPRPLINQFPDLLVLVAPDKQIFITIDNKRVVVTDQSVTDSTERGFESLAKLIIKIRGQIENVSLIAYGFNYSLIVDAENDVTNSGEYLFSKYLAERKEQLESDLEVRSIFASGYRFFSRYGNKKYDLRVEPEMATGMTPTSKFIINQNVHFKSDSLPSLTILRRNVTNEYEKLLRITNNLLNRHE